MGVSGSYSFFTESEALPNGLTFIQILRNFSCRIKNNKLQAIFPASLEF